MKIEAGKYYKTRDGRKVGPMYKKGIEDGMAWRAENSSYWHLNNGQLFECDFSDDDLIAEWTDTPAEPKLWRDMTPAEKGALLLAHHEGKVIQTDYLPQEGVEDWSDNPRPDFDDLCAYRVKPADPVVETVTQFWERERNNSHCIERQGDTHRITFNLVDGKPDLPSIRMEALE